MQKLFLFLAAGLFFFSSCTKKEVYIPNEVQQLFNTSWLFTIDSSQTPGELSEALQWEEVQIPHTPVIEPLVVNDQWQGTCWYKKDIEFKKS